MKDSKVKKSMSVRLDQDVLDGYQSLVEGAGLSISDHMRMQVRNTLDKADALNLSATDVVTCSFNWKKPPPAFPELVGHLLVTVTPPAGLSEEILQRLVFVIPEFWTLPDEDKPSREHFRIDSAYFHRVTDAAHIKTSSKTTRNVMSFHLVESMWVVSIFNYGTRLTETQMQSEIEEKVTQHIVSTIKCYLIGDLPESRILDEGKHAEMKEFLSDINLKKIIDSHQGN